MIIERITLPELPLEPAPELTIIVPTYNERKNVPKIIHRIKKVLRGVRWEAVFVDDDSPDGTADEVRLIGTRDSRIRCLRRLGRRGLAGACLEGLLTSQALYIAVIDADLQHDERLLTSMLVRLRANDADLVVASRYCIGGSSALSGRRSTISAWGTFISRKLLGVNLSDPMSGFFMIRRAIFEDLAPQLSSQGFKILLDIVTTADDSLRVLELPYKFRSRQHGESKLDGKIAVDFGVLLFNKVTRNLVPYRFMLFCLVGLVGVAVHMSVLASISLGMNLSFLTAQIWATLAAITSNFLLNNAFTYRDRRLTGKNLWFGLIAFQAICAVGAISNVGVASLFYNWNAGFLLPGLTGALIGTVWNYVISSTFVWRK